MNTPDMTDEETAVELKRVNRPVKWITWFTISLVVISVFVAGLFAYWGIGKNDVLEIKNNPVPTRTIRPHAAADGVVFLKVDYCKLVAASGKVRTSFVGVSRELFLPLYEDRQPATCEVVEVPVPVPHEIVPGKYHIHYRITYEVNPIKTIVEEFDSQEFEIVKD